MRIQGENMRIKGFIAIFSLFMFTVAYSNNVNEERLRFVGSLFTGEEQYQNLNRVYEIFPTSKLSHSSKPLVFKKGVPLRTAF